MASTTRRRFLMDLLGTLAAGSVVLASASTPPASAGEQPAVGEPPESAEDIQKRAEQLANSAGTGPEEEEEVLLRSFLNRGFTNGVGGGFRNGGFRNAAAGGGFRNGGFANGA